MSFRYVSLLEKKLQELQSQLNEKLCNPTEDTPSPDQNQLLHDDVRRKIEFLKNLLSAEMESHPHGKKYGHLDHIADRIRLLEEAFQNGAEPQTSLIDSLDALSMCSCTFSCFDEDEEEDDGGLDPNQLVEHPMVDRNPVEEESKYVKKQRKGNWLGGAMGRIVCAVVVVVCISVLILLDINNFDRGVKNLLVPT